jgi:hypothetical protein
VPGARLKPDLIRTPGESLHPRPAAQWRANRRRRAYDRVFEEVKVWMKDLTARMASLPGRDLGIALAGADQAGSVQRV